MAFDGTTDKGKQIVRLHKEFDYADTMPECAEKSLIKLHLHFNIKKKIGQEPEAPGYLEDPKGVHTTLNEQLEKEGIVFPDGIDIKNFEELDNTRTYAALKALQPVNIRHINKLLGTGKAESEKYTGKEVTFFVGKIGTGKSTTLRFLAGGKPTYVEKESFEHVEITLDEGISKSVEHITTSPFFSSETTNIQSLSIPHGNQELLFCDTPGFEDTEGPEQDIRNSINLVNSLKKSNAKIVIFISQKMIGDRGENLKQYIEDVTKMFSDIESSLGSVSYAFTKYKQSERNKIRGVLSHLNENLDSSDDQNKKFKAILADMLSKTEHFEGNEENITEIIDYTVDESTLSIQREKLKSTFQNLPANPNPKSSYDYFVTEKSKSKLKDQIEKTRSLIHNAKTQYESGNPDAFAIAAYKINEIKDLNEQLDGMFSIVNDAHKQNMQIKEEIETKTIKNLNEARTLLPSLVGDNLERYSTNFLSEYRILILLNEEKAKQQLGFDLTKQNLSLAQLKEAISVDSNELNSPEIGKYFTQVKLYARLAKALPGNLTTQSQALERKITEADKRVKTLFNDLKAKAVDALDNYNLEGYERYCSQASSMIVSVQMNDLFGNKTPEEVLLTVTSDFSNKIKKLIEKAYQYLSDPQADKADVVIKTFKLIDKIKNDYQQTYSELDLDEDSSALEFAATHAIESTLLQALNNYTTGSGAIFSYVNFNRIIDNIIALRNIESVKEDTAHLLPNLFQKIKAGMDAIHTNIITIWNDLLRGNESEKGLLNDRVAETITALYKLNNKYNRLSGEYSNQFNETIHSISTLLTSESKKSINLKHQHYFQYLRVNKLYNDVKKNHSAQDHDTSAALSIAFGTLQANVLNALHEKSSEVDGKLQTLLEDTPLNKLKIPNNFVKNINKLFEIISSNQNSESISFEERDKRILNILQAFDAFGEYVSKWSHSAYEKPTLTALPELRFYANLTRVLSGFDTFLHPDKMFSMLRQDIDQKINHHNKALTQELDSYTDVTAVFHLDSETQQDVYIKSINEKLTLSIQGVSKSSHINLNVEKIERKTHIFFKKLIELGEAENNIEERKEQVADKRKLLLEGLKASISLIQEPGCEYALAQDTYDYISKHVENLPADLQANIREQLEASPSTIEKKKDNEDNAFTEAGEDITKLTTLLEKTRHAYKFAFAKRVKDKIDKLAAKKLDDTKDLVSSYIGDGNLEQALNTLSNAYNEFYQFTQELHQFVRLPEVIKERCTYFKLSDYTDNQYAESLANIRSVFEAKWAKNLQNLNEQPTEADFDILEMFSQCRSKVSGTRYAAFFPAGTPLSSDKVDSTFEAVKNYYISRQNRIRELLKARCVDSELKNLLDDLKTVDSILKRAKSLSSKFTHVPVYEPFITEINTTFSEWQQKLNQPLLSVAEIMYEAPQSRDQYYADIYKIYEALPKIHVFLSKHIANTKEITGSLPAAVLNLEDSLKSIYTRLENDFNKGTFINTNTNNYYQEVGKWFDNFRSCAENFKEATAQEKAVELLSNLRASLIANITRYVQALDSPQEQSDTANIVGQAKILADHIVHLKQIALSIHVKESADEQGTRILSLKEEIDNIIDDILQTYEDRQASIIPVLCNQLKNYRENNRERAARILLAEHDALAGYATYLRNKATAWLKSDEIIKQLRGNSINDENRNKLQQYYERFQKKYWELVEIGVGEEAVPDNTHDDPLDYIIAQGKAIPKQWFGNERERVSDILAHLFAYWTCHDTRSYEKMKKSNNEGKLADTVDESEKHLLITKDDGKKLLPAKILRRYLFQPHPAQVIALFRLLGVDAKEHVLQRLLKGEITIKAALAELLGDNPFQSFKQLVRLEPPTKPGSSPDEDTSKKKYSIDNLDNHLAQIMSGEGKSVTLAMLASVFALYAHKVDSGCYSKILAERDHEAFKQLFEAFGISEKIRYDDFPALAESLITAGNYFDEPSLRDAVENIMRGNPRSLEKGKLRSKNNIAQLLLDEVDMYFSPDFYGNTYNVLLPLKDVAVSNLTDFVWEKYLEKGDKLALEDITSSDYFKACTNTFKDWGKLLQESVKQMIVALRELDKHIEKNTHIIDNETGKIKYLVGDKYTADKAFGYSTLFTLYKKRKAYQESPYKEPEVKEETLNNYKALYINCGSFSYARLFQDYRHVRGVTGTLEGLENSQKKLLRERMGISEYTYVPSAYGDERERFTFYGVKTSESESHPEAITNEINHYVSNENRAAIVFFKDQKALNTFYKSTPFSDMRERAAIIDETLDKETRDALISAAATTGRVTLATRSFSRGIDYVCYDETLENRGGMHVISTYVPETLADEVQMHKRTGRQGGQGSASWVISAEEIEKDYKITDYEHYTAIRKYEKICQKRNELEAELSTVIVKSDDSNREIHDESVKLLNALKNGNLANYKKLLTDFNACVQYDLKPANVVLMLDATGSMSHLLKDAKETIKIMIDRIQDILKLNNLDPELVKMRIITYRNYNAAKPAEYMTHFTNDKTELREFLDSQRVHGGWGEEAGELAFWKINQWMQETGPKPTHGIMIGDHGTQSDTDASVVWKRCGCTDKNYRMLVNSVSIFKANIFDPEGRELHIAEKYPLYRDKNGYINLCKPCVDADKAALKTKNSHESNGAQKESLSRPACKNKCNYTTSLNHAPQRSEQLLSLEENDFKIDTFTLQWFSKQSSFDLVADSTGGTSELLSTFFSSNKKRAETLVNTVCQSVLAGIGNKKLGKKLTESYQKHYIVKTGGYITSSSTARPSLVQAPSASSKVPSQTNAATGGPSHAPQP